MERIKKKIIIINGKGGCGKDTLCEIAAKKYDVMNVSSITPIKEMAKHIGWEGGKSPEDRKFLADLKALVTEYNDGANEYVVQKAIAFSKTADDVMFVHIREPEMIEHFKETVKHRIPEDIKILTLLVKRDSQKYLVYGNKADDAVEEYDYDFIYNNSKPIEEVEADFLPFLEQMVEGFSSVIPANKDITYSVKVRNDTEKPWKGLKCRLLADDIKIHNANIDCIAIPDLAPGESAVVKFEVNIGSVKGDKKLCTVIVDEDLHLVDENNIYIQEIKVI